MTTRADLTVDRVRPSSKPSTAGAGCRADRFWSGLAALVAELGPRNRGLLERRDEMQAKIDDWCRARAASRSSGGQEAFLREIGYLVPEPAPFRIETENVDPEFSPSPGPQLVVPITNARYALNAANARWGSLYDALYGTDAIDEADGATRGGAYNPVRGAKVIARAKAALDEAAPLGGGKHAEATGYAVRGRRPGRAGPPAATPLADPAGSSAIAARPARPRPSCCAIHGLHIEILIDRAHASARTIRPASPT